MKPALNDGANRLRWLLAGIAALAVLVFARVVALEIWYGDEYREVASRPIERTVRTGAARGRILAKDGTVLAYDREAAALAIHYRYLERPADGTWLRREARRRLTRKERRDALRIEAECLRVEENVTLMHERLANLCGLSAEEYRERLEAVERRVERIADSVRSRREMEDQPALPADNTFWGKLFAWLDDNDTHQAAANFSVAEQFEYHPVFVGLTLDAVAEIEGFPERYPGVRIVTWRQRVYPQGALAAHVVGYVPDASADLALADVTMPSGQQGVERYYDQALRARAGVVVEATDRSGRLLARRVDRAAEPGDDLRLTIDPPLQRSAEELLEQAIERRVARGGAASMPAGGAVVVLDVETGAVACLASTPRFEPETMARANAAALAELFANAAKPLFDRPSQMALPPGSVFKPLTAIALIESGVLEPARPFVCQGFLTSPEKERCQIFRQWQVGHGPLKLTDALAQSCNVFFFHYAAESGARPLIDWAGRFGFGRQTGIDLPDEAAGSIVAGGEIELTRDETLALAIGQGTLTTTPLQITRLLAAIANGGRLVTPHVTGDNSSSASDMAIDDRTLAVVRRGLEQAVADPEGTGYFTVRLDTIDIAGKTGTAETGSGEDHAWFAGYVPTQRPRYAFVVVIEHGGGGGEVAGPVARRLVQRMQSLGNFARRSRLASPAVMPRTALD